MEYQTSDDFWESAFRSLVIVRVADPSIIVPVAKQIFDLNKGLDISKAFIPRATVVSGDYDVVIPVYARFPDILDEVIELILSQEGVDRDLSTALRVDMKLNSQDAYTPWPPHKAEGYIPLDENANPHPGPTGFNPWG